MPQPSEMRVFVMPVRDAPGDGDESLALAHKAHLSAFGIKVTNDPRPDVYTVQGIVDLGATGWSTQSIIIEWSVF
jgi:hypothetical protein